MSQAAYIHVACSAAERTAAFVRSVVALSAGPELSFEASWWGERERVALRVDLSQLEGAVLHHFRSNAALSASFGARLPSGRGASLTVSTAGDEFRERTHDGAAPLTITLDRLALTLQDVTRPRLPPWSPAASAVLVEEATRADTAWLLAAATSACSTPPCAPVVIAWNTEFPALSSSFGVRHRSAGALVRDYAVDWLVARGVVPTAWQAVSLETAELARLVAGRSSDARSGDVPAHEISLLLGQSPERVAAALEALTVVDASQQRLLDLARHAHELLTNAVEHEADVLDWKARDRLFPDVPRWRVMPAPDGAVTIVTSPLTCLADFYAELARLLKET